MLFVKCILWTFVICILTYAYFKFRIVRQRTMRNLMKAAIAIFCVGVVLYVIGFNWEEGSENNAIVLLLRAITSSMEMFVSESGLIEVSEECKENVTYMTIFAITHFLAVCVSAAFILHLIGLRAISYIKMSRLWNLGKSKDLSIFVFFDLSQESMTLANSIGETMKSADNNNYKIIFVRTPLTESHQERSSFSHLLSFADNKNNALDSLMDLDAFLCYSKKQITIGESDDDWKKFVGLTSLRSYIRKRGKEVSFFCMSKDEDANLNSAIALYERYKSDDNVKVYCHLRKEDTHAYIENIKLNIVDSSNLAILMLETDVSNHPISLIGKENVDSDTATVSGKFSAMIIGMDESGRDAFRFLYEFSALPTKDKKELPSEFYLVDSDIEKSLGVFLQSMPSIKEKDYVHCIETTPETLSFWDGHMKALVNELNCIYVTMGSDKENIRIATQLFDYFFRYRDESLPQVSIYVRSYMSDYYAQLEYVVNSFNERARECKGAPRMILFGAMKDIFTYDMVVRNKIQREAQFFHAVYEGNGVNVSPDETSKIWNTDFGEIDKEGKVKNMQVMYNVKRMVQQNFANSLHVGTYICLGGDFDYDKLSDEKKENMARGEHLRWLRAHELLGYSYYTEGGKNPRHKTHPDMVVWEDIGSHLDEAQRADYIKQQQYYDYRVVEISYLLHSNLKKT